MMMLGLFCMATSFFPLYLKYRVVLTGERCKGKRLEKRFGYSRMKNMAGKCSNAAIFGWNFFPGFSY